MSTDWLFITLVQISQKKSSLFFLFYFFIFIYLHKSLTTKKNLEYESILKRYGCRNRRSRNRHRKKNCRLIVIKFTLRLKKKSEICWWIQLKLQKKRHAIFYICIWTLSLSIIIQSHIYRVIPYNNNIISTVSFKRNW